MIILQYVCVWANPMKYSFAKQHLPEDPGHFGAKHIW